MSNVDYLLYDLAFHIELAFSYAYPMSKNDETIMKQTVKLAKLKSYTIIMAILIHFLQNNH
jgi:hypothetical protein